VASFGALPSCVVLGREALADAVFVVGAVGAGVVEFARVDVDEDGVGVGVGCYGVVDWYGEDGEGDHCCGCCRCVA